MSPKNSPQNQQCGYSNLIQRTHDQKKPITSPMRCIKIAYRQSTTRDTWKIKQHVNQLMQVQSKQQKILVHVISILNITRYAAQVNRQKLNEVMGALQRSNGDSDRLFNITETLAQCNRYQQMYIYMCTILAYLRDSLTCMRHVAIHTMDYVDSATTNVLLSDILPVEDLRNMLGHIESEFPSMMHLPISSDNTLHFS